MEKEAQQEEKLKQLKNLGDVIFKEPRVIQSQIDMGMSNQKKALQQPGAIHSFIHDTLLDFYFIFHRAVLCN